MSDHKDDDQQLENTHIRIPTTVSLRDVIVVVLAVISIVTAWGVYGTRLSILEGKVVDINDGITELKQMIREVKQESKSSFDNVRTEVDSVDNRVRLLEEKQARIEGSMRNKR